MALACPRLIPKLICVPCQSKTPFATAKLAQEEHTKTWFFCLSGTAGSSRDFARPFNHSLWAVSSSALPRKQPFLLAPDETHPAAKAGCAKMSPTHGSASEKPVLSVHFIIFWWDGLDLSNYASSRFYWIYNFAMVQFPISHIHWWTSNIQFHIYTDVLIFFFQKLL